MNLATFVMAAASCVLGGFVFFMGYMIKNQPAQGKSHCSDNLDPSFPKYIVNGTETPLDCWSKPQFRKVVVLLVDAFRYDFAAPLKKPWQPEPEKIERNQYYHEKMPWLQNKIKETLEGRHDEARWELLKFVADAPTSTSQRVQSFATGGMSAYIEALWNSARHELEGHDTVIDQLAVNDKKIVFLGDDTWAVMFPDRYIRSHGGYGFQMLELDKTDTILLDNIYNELERDDWQVMIAHFLGVDHCGHNMGPGVPEMTDKLGQFDEIIKKVTSYLDDDTLLVVMGDHGMTESGDHGGGTSEERESTLVLHSKKLYAVPKFDRREINQMDIVPTLSLLLGVPIPFGSMGRVIHELFHKDPANQRHATEANLWQVARHAETIFNPDHSIPELGKKDLSDAHLRETVEKFKLFFRNTATKFDVGWMGLGMAVLLEAVLWMVTMSTAGETSDGQHRLRMSLKAASLAVGALVVAYQHAALRGLLGVLVAVQILLEVPTVASTITTLTRIDRRAVVLLAPSLIHGLLAFSPWTILNENLLVVGLTAISFTFLVAHSTFERCSFFSKDSMHKRLSIVIGSPMGRRNFIGLVVGAFFISLGVFFGRCRDGESSICLTSNWALAFRRLYTRPIFQLFRTMTTVFACFAMVVLPLGYLWTKRFLSGDSLLTKYLVYGPPVAVTMQVLRWSVHWMDNDTWQKNTFVLETVPAFTSLAYCISGIFLLLATNWPLNHTFTESALDSVSSSRPSPNYLVGRYVAFFLLFNMLLVTVICSEGLVASLFIYVAVVVFAFWLAPRKRRSLNLVAFFSIVCAHGYFVLGHVANWSALPWRSTQTGDIHYQPMQAVFLFTDMLSSHLLIGFALPLIVIWRKADEKPAASGRTEKATRLKRTNSEARGPTDANKEMWQCSTTFMALIAYKLLMTTISCSLHMRHPQVWTVFGPKFVFDAFCLCGAAGAMLISGTLASSYNKRLSRPKQA